MSYELPPQVNGSEELAALRDYLVRLAQSLESVTDRAAAAAADKAVTKTQRETARDIQSQAASLKALIVKNAEELCSYADSRLEEYGSLYVARSDFGNYYEQIETQVETTARSAVESYRYAEAIEGLAGSVSELSGQIRRGLITHNGQTHLGIAVSENLQFSGTQVVNGVSYSVIRSDQTFGLYTSRGWEFWIRGVLCGFFSAEDSMLHVSNVVVENALQLGALWQITASGGFGLRCIGG